MVYGYTGKFFEDFKVGERTVHRYGRTVTYQDNLYFTHSLLNSARLHFDREYMDLTEFKQPLLVATMTLAIAYGITSFEYPNIAGELEIADLSFHSPVFDGDTLHVETEVLEVKDLNREDYGEVNVKYRVYKQNFKTLVCEFRRRFYVYKRNYRFSMMKGDKK